MPSKVRRSIIDKCLIADGLLMLCLFNTVIADNSTTVPANMSTNSSISTSVSTGRLGSTSAVTNTSAGISSGTSTSIPLAINTSTGVATETSASTSVAINTSRGGSTRTSISTSAPINTSSSVSAGTSTNATTAINTSSSVSAGTSTNATTAINTSSSVSAGTSTNATTAINTSSSVSAGTSTSATTAINTSSSVSAGTSTNATTAINTSSSVSAGTSISTLAPINTSNSVSTGTSTSATTAINTSSSVSAGTSISTLAPINTSNSVSTGTSTSATTAINTSSSVSAGTSTGASVASTATDTSIAASRSSSYTNYIPSSVSKAADQTTIRATRPADSNIEHKIPPSYSMPTETLEIVIPFQVAYTECHFNDSLKNSSSEYYQRIQKIIKEELEIAFNGTSGYQSITIIGMWEGNTCVEVNFTASFKNVSSQILKDQLGNGVYRRLNTSSFNTTFLDQTFQQAVASGLRGVCKGQLNKCPRDYNCLNTDERTICEHVCAQHENMCVNGGYCVVDTDYKPVCRCPEDGSYVYGGEICDMKAEQLAMSKEHIIAIAAGVGGGIILILVVVIIISLRRGRKNRLQKDNVLDNISEQSFKSFKSSEDGTHQPVTQPGNDSSLSYDNPMFRLSEERAENPRFNPYLPRSNIQQQVGRPQIIGLNDHRAADRQREQKKNSESRQFHDRVPNYGDPVQLPQFQRAPLSSNFLKADDGQSKSYVYQPTKAIQPLSESRQQNPLHQPTEIKVYDYYHYSDADAIGSAHPHNDTNLYDFEYENSSRLESGINDPYAIKRPLVSSRRQF